MDLRPFSYRFRFCQLITYRHFVRLRLLLFTLYFYHLKVYVNNNFDDSHESIITSACHVITSWVMTKCLLFFIVAQWKKNVTFFSDLNISICYCKAYSGAFVIWILLHQQFPISWWSYAQFLLEFILHGEPMPNFCWKLLFMVTLPQIFIIIYCSWWTYAQFIN